MALSTPSTVLPRNIACASSGVSRSPSSLVSSASTRLARCSLSMSTPSQSKISAGSRSPLNPISVFFRVQIDERRGAATQHVLGQYAIPFLHRFPFHQLGILLQRLGADLHGLGLGFGRQHLLPRLLFDLLGAILF